MTHRVSVHTVPRGGYDWHATRKEIDWTNSSDRKWLMNHLHHAMNNRKVVTLQPINPEIPEIYPNPN